METIERKSATIMFTDIYGYSRMMSINEGLAMSILTEHDRIVDKIIDFYKGNIIKKMGDAVLADFKSPAEALNCAIEIQTALKAHNDTKPVQERIIVRIGLHMGKVIIKNNDLFGQDMNVAARLESLADPGGICLSQAVYDAVKEHLDSKILKIGDVALKNIIQKYVIYKIPSLYGDEFHGKTSSEVNNKYKISTMTDIPVRYLAPSDLTILTLLFCSAFLVATNYFTLGYVDLDSILLLLQHNFASISVLILSLVLLVIYFYANKSVRIVFDDIREPDKLLEFLATQMGYDMSLRQNNILIFKPTLYQFIMYSARKIKAVIDGNSVTITGNYMFVRKLAKLIKSFETSQPGH